MALADVAPEVRSTENKLHGGRRAVDRPLLVTAGEKRIVVSPGQIVMGDQGKGQEMLRYGNIWDGEQGVYTFNHQQKDRFTIGRNEGDLVLGDKSVSRKQAFIGKEKGALFLQDGDGNEPSTYGTGVEEIKPALTRKPIKDKPEYFVDDRRPIAIYLGSEKVVIKANEQGHKIAITSKGREIPFTTLPNGVQELILTRNVVDKDNPQISRLHAGVRFQGDVYQVRDLGSGNGTEVQIDGLEPERKVVSDAEIERLEQVVEKQDEQKLERVREKGKRGIPGYKADDQDNTPIQEDKPLSADRFAQKLWERKAKIKGKESWYKNDGGDFYVGEYTAELGIDGKIRFKMDDPSAVVQERNRMYGANKHLDKIPLEPRYLFEAVMMGDFNNANDVLIYVPLSASGDGRISHLHTIHLNERQAAELLQFTGKQLGYSPEMILQLIDAYTSHTKEIGGKRDPIHEKDVVYQLKDIMQSNKAEQKIPYNPQELEGLEEFILAESVEGNAGINYRGANAYLVKDDPRFPGKDFVFTNYAYQEGLDPNKLKVSFRLANDLAINMQRMREGKAHIPSLITEAFIGDDVSSTDQAYINRRAIEHNAYKILKFVKEGGDIKDLPPTRYKPTDQELQTLLRLR